MKIFKIPEGVVKVNNCIGIVICKTNCSNCSDSRYCPFSNNFLEDTKEEKDEKKEN